MYIGKCVFVCLYVCIYVYQVIYSLFKGCLQKKKHKYRIKKCYMGDESTKGYTGFWNIISHSFSGSLQFTLIGWIRE